MRVQTEEWQRFIPGVRMYKGKKTLFYNGEKLFDDETGEWFINEEERDSWQVIIVLPGVEVIPNRTFTMCKKINIVIMADTVRRVEQSAFYNCTRLVFVRLSRNLEYIEGMAFAWCSSLTSIFIPPSCREIWNSAFWSCKKLIIFAVPQDIQLGRNVIEDTALIEVCPFETNTIGYDYNQEGVNDWIRNQNMAPEYELHRACSTFNPIQEIVYGIVKRKGLKAFHVKNAIGITPLQFLEANPFSDIDQKKMITQYVLEMMGEVV
ncbi:hypothetical protein CTEN210_16008 [Chaetoceros tenuissimus]|uniref:Leucine-rich repeat domain-containing protein n=1 Tax=Chaetoceros tenuissimus TaxID=426638 RepID=A0AAD3D7V1_9STRA|nr:hypothetical protein CTEN210_16008 [Chaetoceros tenuissimus]